MFTRVSDIVMALFIYDFIKFVVELIVAICK